VPGARGDGVRLLDLFCGAGGAAMGYHRAGFEVVGVDHLPQPHYPFEFHQADAMTYPLDGFDAIHASPPCQAYSVLNAFIRRDYPELIEPVRQRAEGLPLVIENVVGAPLREPLLLCGQMFGLRLFRHRLFELPFFALQPGHTHGRWRAPRRGKGNVVPQEGEVWSPTGHMADWPNAARAMGICWMGKRQEVAEAIPPAYTYYVGCKLMVYLGHEDPFVYGGWLSEETLRAGALQRPLQEGAESRDGGLTRPEPQAEAAS